MVEFPNLKKTLESRNRLPDMGNSYNFETGVITISEENRD